MRLFFSLAFLLGHTAFAQTSLRGTVKDEANSAPLQFATIAIQGQPYGTLSEIDGNFVLTAPITLGAETKIQISFLGYATKIYRLGELQHNGDVSLSNAGVDLPIARVSAEDAGPLTDISLGRVVCITDCRFSGYFDNFLHDGPCITTTIAP